MIVYGCNEKGVFMNKNELTERLLDLDRDAQLMFSEESEFKCYIVGGSALVLMGYSIRATHDIDILERYPKEISLLFSKYDMNTSVVAYYDCFPSDFEERAIPIDVPTKMVKFYTLSLEDLVISKLFTTRYNQDITDINDSNIVDSLDWNKLKILYDQIIKEKMSGIDVFSYNYNEYIRRNKL